MNEQDFLKNNTPKLQWFFKRINQQAKDIKDIKDKQCYTDDDKRVLAVQENIGMIFKVLTSHSVSPEQNIFEDCFFAGVEAIIVSLPKYDITKGALPTFLFWYIRKNIQDMLKYANHVSYGSHGTLALKAPKGSIVYLDMPSPELDKNITLKENLPNYDTSELDEQLIIIKNIKKLLVYLTPEDAEFIMNFYKDTWKRLNRNEEEVKQSIRRRTTIIYRLKAFLKRKDITLNDFKDTDMIIKKNEIAEIPINSIVRIKNKHITREKYRLEYVI